MTRIQRVKKICKWLIFSDVAENETGLAKLLGYTRPAFSQIMNEKVPLSEKFIDKLISLDKNINKKWVLDGTEEMLIIEFSIGKSKTLDIESTRRIIEIKDLNTEDQQRIFDTIDALIRDCKARK